MRKLLLCLLTCLLLFVSSGVVLVADDAAFVPSMGYKNDITVPDNDEPPEDEDGQTTTSIVTNTEENSTIERKTILDEDPNRYCVVDIVITPYPQKDTIESPESKEQIEIAYQQILATPTVYTLAPAVEDYVEANKLDLDDEDLVFSNVFDITVYNDEHGLHDADYDHSTIYNVKVSAETLKNFVCLLHYNTTTKVWEVVNNVEQIGDNILRFSYPSASPFAIVAKTGDGVVKAKRDSGSGSDSYRKAVDTQTGAGLTASHICLFQIGNTCYCWVIGIIAALSLFINIFLIIRNKEIKKYIK